MVVITVSGPPGSGKSTVARKIAELLNLRLVSAGQLFREIAKSRGVDILVLNKQAEQDFSIDRQVDLRSIAEATKGNVIIEGHLTGWIVQEADLKIYLNAPIEIRAKRIAERESVGLTQALNETLERELSEKDRFKKIYGLNLDSLNNFDLVVNTSIYELEDLLEMILHAILKSKPIKEVMAKRQT
jgi:cytidylate kinase